MDHTNCLTFAGDDAQLHPAIRLQPNEELDPRMLYLQIGIRPPNDDWPRIDERIPLFARLHVEKQDLPEIIRDDAGPYILSAEVVPLDLPVKPSREPRWDKNTAYHPDQVVQDGSRVYTAKRKVPVGTPLTPEHWEKKVQSHWRFGSRLPNSDKRYIYLECGAQEQWVRPGILLPEHRFGNVLALIKARYRFSKEGKRYSEEYLLSMSPGSAVKFTMDNGQGHALVYPTDMSRQDECAALNGILAFNSWEEFDQWVVGNPGWNKEIENIDSIPVTMPTKGTAPRRQPNAGYSAAALKAAREKNPGAFLGLPETAS